MTGVDRQGCLPSLMSFLTGTGRRGSDQELERLPYRLRDDFLSPAELSFYRALLLAVRGEVTVCAKVNLQDIFFTERPHENQAYHNKISSKHLDFLVCRSSTMLPIVGIELDDASHRNPDRQERDAFVGSVFETAGLPLLHFPVRSAYDVQSLADAVGKYTGAPAEVAPVGNTGTRPAAATHDSSPLCPKCGVPMVIRTASRGGHQGEAFYGCPNYPRCREIFHGAR